MRHESRPWHGGQPSLLLSIRHGEVDGADISIRTARDTAGGDMRVYQIQLRLPIHTGVNTR